MSKMIPLHTEGYFHIFNCGNNREKIFFEERNYSFFLRLYERHILPVADTFAWCLMPNHFHFLVRIKSENEMPAGATPAQSFSNLFNAYAKAINKAQNRTGSVFERQYHRIAVTTDEYLQRLVLYIHYNPQKHHHANNYSSWKWSSFNVLASNSATKLDRSSVMDWFGDVRSFMLFHEEYVEDKKIQQYVEGDDAF